jgi:hypothetical protein
MELPFTRDAFFALFGQYNLAVWPLIVLFYLMAGATVALLFRPTRAATMFIALGLGAMWVVNGAGYHWMFFREINPAAAVFGAVFLLQAVLLVFLPVRDASFRFAVAVDARSAVGLLLILFAIVLYPLWGWGAGHIWPRIPAFGVAPCPTTIFTIGVLLTGSWHVVRWLLIVPGLWAGVGGSAAILLGVPQDSALLAALVLLILFAVARMSGMDFARHTDGGTV